MLTPISSCSKSVRYEAACQSPATVNPGCTGRDAGGGDAGENEMFYRWGKTSLGLVGIENINRENDG